MGDAQMGGLQMGNCVVGVAPKNPPLAVYFTRPGSLKIASDNQPSPTIPSTLIKPPSPNYNHLPHQSHHLHSLHCTALH